MNFILPANDYGGGTRNSKQSKEHTLMYLALDKSEIDQCLDQYQNCPTELKYHAKLLWINLFFWFSRLMPFFFHYFQFPYFRLPSEDSIVYLSTSNFYFISLSNKWLWFFLQTMTLFFYLSYLIQLNICIHELWVKCIISDLCV